MPAYKCVFQYTQPDKGFSEVYFRSEPTLADAATFANSFINSLQTIRNPLTLLRKIRVSEVTNNRNSIVVPITPIRNDNTDTPDVCATAAVITLNAPETGARRQLWLRGLNDGSVRRDEATGADDMSPGFRTRLNNLLQAMENQFVYIQSLKKLGVAPLVSTPIVSITKVVPGLVTINTAVDWAITDSKRVVLSGIDAKRFGGLNGIFTATTVGSRAFSVRYNCVLPAATYEVTTGKTRPAEYEYGRILKDFSGFNKFSPRDTGRNPLGGRGRRSATIRRSA